MPTAPPKIIQLFLYLAGVLLLITAIAKLVSAGNTASIWQTTDPVFSISFRAVFWIVGIIELITAAICFVGKRLALQAVLVVWLSTSFLAYRLGLWWLDWHLPCPCLGSMAAALHIPPQIADIFLKIIFGYLLVGSYATLLWLWRQSKKAERRMQNEIVAFW